jgi:hypothetical protein
MPTKKQKPDWKMNIQIGTRYDPVHDQTANIAQDPVKAPMPSPIPAMPWYQPRPHRQFPSFPKPSKTVINPTPTFTETEGPVTYEAWSFDFSALQIASTKASSAAKASGPAQSVREDSAMPESARQSLSSFVSVFDEQSKELAEVKEKPDALEKHKIELLGYNTSYKKSSKEWQERCRTFQGECSRRKCTIEKQQDIIKEQELTITRHDAELKKLRELVDAMSAIVKK